MFASCFAEEMEDRIYTYCRRSTFLLLTFVYRIIPSIEPLKNIISLISSLFYEI